MTKSGSMLFAVLNGLSWLLQVAACLLLSVCGAVVCEMEWLMAELAVLGGSVG